MEYCYGARGKFNSSIRLDTWENYKQWINLSQLVDLISLDGNLNEDIIDNKSVYIPDCEIIDNDIVTGLYSSLEFVINEVKTVNSYNLLTLVKNPRVECNSIKLIEFEFIGYDLLDVDYMNSALTNCGGFYESYSPSDINEFGLISDFEKAVKTKKLIKINNPGEPHADTNMFAIWRHNLLGR